MDAVSYGFPVAVVLRQVSLTALEFYDKFMQIFATTKVRLCHAVHDLLNNSASADTE